MHRAARAALLVCAGLLLSAQSDGGAGRADMPAARSDKPLWVQRFAMTQADAAAHHPDLVLLGDSITQELQGNNSSGIDAVWQRYYACRNAADMGFAGDTTANLLWRISNGQFGGAHPRVAMVMIGTNNMPPRLGWAPEDTVAGILAVIAEIQRQSPQTRILLLSIPPGGQQPAVQQKIAQVNASLAAHAWGPGVTYLDISPALLRDGQADPALYLENRPMLHPNAAGWERLAAAIEPTLAGLAGGHAPCPGAPPPP